MLSVPSTACLLENCSFSEIPDMSDRQPGIKQASNSAVRYRSWPVPSLKFRRRHADTARKEGAEASQTGETDCHTNVGDRQIGQNQQMLGFLDLRPRAILVRGFAKDSLKQPNEMKTREPGNPSHSDDGKRLVFQSRNKSRARQSRLRSSG